MASYRVEPPFPGETLEHYLWRQACHPDHPNPRRVTDAEMACFDRTEEVLAAGLAGITFVPQAPACAPAVDAAQVGGVDTPVACALVLSTHGKHP